MTRSITKKTEKKRATEAPAKPKIEVAITKRTVGTLDLSFSQIVDLIREAYPAIPEDAMFFWNEEAEMGASEARALSIGWDVTREVDPEEMGCHGDC